VKRREFIALVGGALVCPLSSVAQQAKKVARIGVLSTSSPETLMTFDAFRQGLRELGYVEGTNIFVEYRTADGKMERFPDLLSELIRLNVDVIVSLGAVGAQTAGKASTRVPSCSSERSIRFPSSGRFTGATRRERHWDRQL